MSDGAIANLVTGLVTLGMGVIGFLTLWIRLAYGVQKAEEAAVKASVVESKIDANTALTRAGTEAATKNARQAASVAVEAKEATETMSRNLDKKLNGGIDAAIEAAVAPLRDKINNVIDYVHQRNHDMLNALQQQSCKIDTLIEKMNKLNK